MSTTSWSTQGSAAPPVRRCPYCNAPETLLRKGGPDGKDRLCTACTKRWNTDDETALRVAAEVEKRERVEETDPVEDAVNTAAEATDPDDENAEGWEKL